ncbi:extradiol dioxygenase [Blastococcus capsensis]|uniref:extradiol dioxygenase n=1 Tax=Blastococcus capsensis TaxID=1564163 RepID=UPI002541F03E|nr:extradiol dioxygenase [Blastococcus capsensis]MDK3254914.1 extradiol dioxygenase [Blastococcus capsensis]
MQRDCSTDLSPGVPGFPTGRPILVTPVLERLPSYVGLFDAQATDRFPQKGPLFHLGLRLGNSGLGLTADSAVGTGFPGRVLLNVEVPDVDAVIPRVAGLGGTAPSGANDMPWGASPTSPTPTATR